VAEDIESLSTLNSVYYRLRGIGLAPFKLLREYLVLILAFLLVGLSIFYGFDVLL
jgi:hypothetical protein